MDEIQLHHLKGAVEALLFVSEKPVGIDQFKDAIAGAQPPDLREALKALMADYVSVGKGMVIVEIANGWQMLSAQEYAPYIREFYKTRHKEKLSRPALETLAIIAYKQPVSRTDVELIRGVNSDGVVMHLLNKGLIKIAGRKEVPGRPYVYGTTGQFLEYFGLRSLEDMPRLEEFPSLIASADVVAATPQEQQVVAEEIAVSGDEGVEAMVEAPQRKEPSAQECDDLAKERMRLDIEQLEKETRSVDIKDEAFEALGESSGQSRHLGKENPDGLDTSA